MKDPRRGLCQFNDGEDDDAHGSRTRRIYDDDDVRVICIHTHGTAFVSTRVHAGTARER
jgi:hypothetical protein